MVSPAGTTNSSRSFPSGGRETGIPRWTHYLELTKPRLSLLSVVTVLVGYFAAKPTVDPWALLHLMAGTSLAAGGAAALNQWWERTTDAGMERTRNRPLPAGRVRPRTALLMGSGLCLLGAVLLAAGVNPLAGFLLVLTVATYILAYTPLKKRTHWCTEVGAVSGALPPLIGWAGAEGAIGAGGWVLFGILFFWQMPHFHAIAWLYRDDYGAVGFPMLATADPSGARVARHMTFYGALLLLCAAAPTAIGQAGFFYLAAAIALSGYFLGQILRFKRAPDRTGAARKIFFVSILYLPLLLGCLVFDVWILQ